MSELDTLKAIAPLQLAYTNELSEERMDFYVEMLKDIPAESLGKAVRQIIYTSKFLPSIAEIRSYAIDTVKVENGTKEPDADEAWGEVQRAIRAVGYMKTPSFSNPVVADAVRSLGWQDICTTPADDTGILRAQFRRAYEAALGRQKQRELHQAVGVIPAKEPQIKILEGSVKQLAAKMSM